MDEIKESDLYDVIFFWDNTRDPIAYRQYCGETLCNVLGFTPPLSVKLVFEAKEKGKVLIHSTHNIEKAVSIRDVLSSLDMPTQICPNVISNIKK
jgi:hypothetical protein